MTFNEIRLVQHLVESAHAIAQDDRGAAVLGTYEGFECVMWPDDADLKKWQVTRKQFRRCCEAAFAELKQSEITREKLTPRSRVRAAPDKAHPLSLGRPTQSKESNMRMHSIILRVETYEGKRLVGEVSNSVEFTPRQVLSLDEVNGEA